MTTGGLPWLHHTKTFFKNWFTGDKTGVQEKGY